MEREVEHRLTEVEERSKSNTHRLDEVERRQANTWTPEEYPPAWKKVEG